MLTHTRVIAGLVADFCSCGCVASPTTYVMDRNVVGLALDAEADADADADALPSSSGISKAKLV